MEVLSEDLRRTARNLHPFMLTHLGLEPALRAYCEEFSKLRQIKVRFTARALPGTIPSGVALCVYRVVQEALGNVAKHAGAKRAVVSISGSDDVLHVAIRDDGHGFDLDQAKGKGLGLISMEERVRHLGGTFSISSKARRRHPHRDPDSPRNRPAGARGGIEHTMKKPRLLLADDHTILLEGLKALLAPEFEVVATAADGRAVLEAAEKHQPDLILLDISMPGLNGIEAARRLKQSNPGAKLIILTMHADLSFVSAAFEAGVSGYVLKQSAATELVTALHDVDSGRRYISSLIQKRLGTEMPAFLRRPKKLSADLTSRQREVLQLVAEGRVRKEIAQILGVSVKTVEFHKQKITEKLGIHTDAALTAYAIRHGIASAE